MESNISETITAELSRISDRISKIEKCLNDNSEISNQNRFEISKIERSFTNQYELKIAEYNELLDKFSTALNSISNENCTIKNEMAEILNAISEERTIQKTICEHVNLLQNEHAKTAELLAAIPRKTNELFNTLQKRQNLYIQDLPHILRDHMTHRIDKDITPAIKSFADISKIIRAETRGKRVDRIASWTALLLNISSTVLIVIIWFSLRHYLPDNIKNVPQVLYLFSALSVMFAVYRITK